ncbi:MAG: hypothetical protein WD060_01855 [Pirellulales bacterium]
MRPPVVEVYPSLVKDHTSLRQAQEQLHLELLKRLAIFGSIPPNFVSQR